MNNKNEIYLKLASNLIIDFLKSYVKNNNFIIFNESDCSGYKSIRFSTITLQNKFKPVNKNIGYFKNGNFAYYEIKPEDNNWIIYLNASKIDLPYDLYIVLNSISNNIVLENENLVTLYKCNLIGINADIQNVIKRLEHFLEKEIANVENNVFKENNFSLNEKNSFVYNFDDDVYFEGALNEIYNNKYERNQNARNKCIEYYGAKCQICGFDFSKVYGNEFKYKIHVHHKVPLSEIKKEYIVDPIKDLIPVCPNCHMILHSKKDGVYTIEEVIKIIKMNK